MGIEKLPENTNWEKAEARSLLRGKKIFVEPQNRSKTDEKPGAERQTVQKR
jgi:hypothetical protein